MKGSTIGRVFRVTTYGESHGPALGVVIDGCPSGVPLSEADFRSDLLRRQGGNSPWSTPRKEPESVQIDSGVFEGLTSGAPIALRIANENARSADYEKFRDIPRPGHADLTVHLKHKVRDFRGGGRLSARETTARVLAGVVAKKLLPEVRFCAFLRTVGPIECDEFVFHDLSDFAAFEQARTTVLQRLQKNSLPLPVDTEKAVEVEDFLHTTRQNNDSLGGRVELWMDGVPAGLGEPVFEKLSARFAAAMMSLPAAVAFECGGGSVSCSRPGSQVRDAIEAGPAGAGDARVADIRHGGQLGGISTGSPVFLQVGFHAPTSIQQPARSVSLRTGEPETVSVGGRHDVFPLVRALVMVEAMAAITLVDMLALSGRLPDYKNF